MTLEPLETLQYQRLSGQSIVRCCVEVFDDGAYVVGDEIEMIFEFAPDSVERAIKHVERLGYVRVS